MRRRSSTHGSISSRSVESVAVPSTVTYEYGGTWSSTHIVTRGSRRRLRPLSVPENRTVGPPACTGLGSHQISSKETVGEEKEAPLVDFAGARIVHGHNGQVNGRLERKS